MRFEWLFVRWLVIFALVALGARYLWVTRDDRHGAQYQKVVLLQSASSFDLPLAGIAIDPQRREVYGLLGRAGRDVPADFFILWTGTKGESFGATFSGAHNDMTGLCEILPHGQTRMIRDFRSAQADQSTMPDRSEALQSIVNALPPDPTLPGRQ
ncbi:MAG: hypothetical protein M3032_12410 [Verrucomicrobiota bacterium]|nr:hypothetical protein [Verrucomicrobiota bacterium]